SAVGSRYSVDVRPGFSLLDIGINAALTLLHLRDINLARAEEEVGREIALRLPIAERNVATLTADAHTPPAPPPKPPRAAATIGLSCSMLILLIPTPPPWG